MGLMRAFLALCLIFLFAGQAFAIDEITVTLTSGADIATRRATLATQIYGVGTLPTTQSTVTLGVSDPYSGAISNVASVDRYLASMSNGQSNTSLLYRANSPNLHRVVIVNMGHQSTCTWPMFDSVYGTTELLTALLGAGYSVYAMNMPECGDATAHQTLFTNYGDEAMGFFFEPATQAMNYWDAHASFIRYDYVGLSGGGYTATLLAAMDVRVKLSISVGGSMPGVQFISPCGACGNLGDGTNTSEQGWSNFFTAASYIDLYLMASYGVNREHHQFLNRDDNCCFGVTQWVSQYSSAHSGRTWAQYIDSYNAVLQAAIATINPARYNVEIDTVATAHQISSFARGRIITLLGEAPLGGRPLRYLQREPANDNEAVRFASGGCDVNAIP